MSSISREQIQEDFDALRAVVSRVLEHSYDALTSPERLALLGGWNGKFGGCGCRGIS